MGKQAAAVKVVLSVIIHPTAASLRFGGDGYFITFAGTEQDKEEAAKLILLKNTPLKLTIEVDDEYSQEQARPEAEESPASKPSGKNWYF